jgi:hypothetical protein
MDAIKGANWRRLGGTAVVAIGLFCFATAARAEVLVQTQMAPAQSNSQVQVIEQAADGEWCGAYASYERLPSCIDAADDQPATIRDAVEAQILAAILLIPPPVDLVTPIPTSTPDSPHAVVTGGPGLQNSTVPPGGGANSQILHTEGAPEPTSFLLAAVGGGLAAASAWYRRRKARRSAQELQMTVETVAV